MIPVPNSTPDFSRLPFGALGGEVGRAKEVLTRQTRISVATFPLELQTGAFAGAWISALKPNVETGLMQPQNERLYIHCVDGEGQLFSLENDSYWLTHTMDETRDVLAVIEPGVPYQVLSGPQGMVLLAVHQRL